MDTSALDEKYLRELASTMHLKLPKELIDYQIKNIAEEIDESIKKGDMPVYMKEKMIKQRFDEIHGISFRPPQLIKIQKYALDTIGKNKNKLEKIPIGMISNLETNAYAIKTPYGGKVIALSYNLWMHMRNLFYCFDAIILRDTEIGFGKHHPDTVYINNIYNMINAINSNALLMFVKGDKDSLLDVIGQSSKPELSVVFSLEYALTFILLHEYGHIVLGHLNDNEVSEYNISNKNFDVFNIQHSLEYQADQYAIMKMWGTEELSFADNYTTALSILKFFFILDLCELLDNKTSNVSHPPALKRVDNMLKFLQVNTNINQWNKIYQAILYYSSRYNKIYNSILNIKNKLSTS